jgi:hypothetical protein
VQIDDAENAFIPGLNFSPILKRSQVVADVKLTAGLDPR